MKRQLQLWILLLLAPLILSTGLFASYADTKTDEPVNLGKKCSYTDARKRSDMAERLADVHSEKRYVTRYVLDAENWVAVSWKADLGVDFVYYEWTDKEGVDPAPYTVELLDEHGDVVETREGEPFWNNGVAIPEGVYGVRLTPHAEAELCTLIPYSGGAPKDYHPWKPTQDKTDFLVIATHPDDDALFMGNVTATYAGERGYDGAILYLATRTRIRRTEALNGAWIMGIRSYPLMAGLPDIPMKYREEKQRDFLPEDVERTVVRCLRRLKPDVVVTHDDNGEYGHWQHIIVAAAVRLAVTDTADPNYDPESAAQYGVWQVKKLYLHLAQENPIFIKATDPLSAFDGRTGWDIAQEAYQCHQSQRLWNHPCNNENECSLEKFGLVFSTVGTDSGVNDLFENVANGAVETTEPTEEPTPEPTEEPTPEPTEEPTDMPVLEQPAKTEESVPLPTETAAVETTVTPIEPTEAPETEPTPERSPDMNREDLTFWIVIGIALALAAVGIVVLVLQNRRFVPEDEPRQKPRRLLVLWIVIGVAVAAAIALAVFILLKNRAVQPDVKPQAAETPETITSLLIATADDAQKLSLYDTIETVQIKDGALSNAEAQALVNAHPDVCFTYRVQVGDRFVPSDATELERAEGESFDTLADAVPFLGELSIVRLGALEPAEIEAAEALFGPVKIAYSVLLDGTEIAMDVRTLDLRDTDVSAEKLIAAMPYLPALKELDFGEEADPDTVASFIKADTGLNLKYAYTFTYLDRTLTESTDTLDLTGEQIPDLDELKQVLWKLPKLRHTEMVDCGIDDATMAELRDEFPDAGIVWEIDLGFWGKLRTDAIAYTTRSSKRPDEMKYRLKTENIQPLQYCTDLVALDLGHQRIEDISCLSALHKLQVLILADNRISDISALASMPELIYVELFYNHVEDLTPLSGLKHLKDLNICSNHVSDVTPLYSVTTLERLWYSGNRYEKEDHQALQAQLTNCICNNTVYPETEDGWREHERYFWMRAFFENSPRYIIK